MAYREFGRRLHYLDKLATAREINVGMAWGTPIEARDKYGRAHHLLWLAVERSLGQARMKLCNIANGQRLAVR